MYLSGYAAHLMMLIVIVLWLPLALQPESFKQLPLTFLGLGGLGLPVEYVLSQLALYRGHGLRKLIGLPVLMSIGFGLAFNNGLAVIDGLINRSGEFKRTPKRGANQNSSIGLDAKQAWQAWVEIGLSIYTLIAAVFMIEDGQWITAGVLLIYTIGFALVGLGTMRWPRRRVVLKPSTEKETGLL
jgi:hypothetical protein